MTPAQLAQLPIDQLRLLERTAQHMADEKQREAAQLQRDADRIRKHLRKRA